MNWEEIIISALKNNENLDLALKKAEKVAPKDISLILKKFPGSIQEIKKVETCPKVISLLYYHFLVVKGIFFQRAPLDQQEGILKTSIHASFQASFISRELGEKALEAQYLEAAGNSFYQCGEFAEAEKALNKALEKYRRCAKQNPERHNLDVITVLNDLGALYLNTKEFFETERVFGEALELCSGLARQNPESYTPYVAQILQNFGILYWYTGKIPQAEEFYKKALEKLRSIERHYPEFYGSCIAQILRNLGTLYWTAKEFFKAEEVLLESLKIEKNLTQNNPEMYQFRVANTLKTLGILYRSLIKLPEAENALKEALKIYQRTASKNPVYSRHVASTLHNLGNLYWDVGDFTEAEKTFKKALEEFKNLAQENSGLKHDIAGTLAALGNIYNITQRYDEAEKTYEKALEIFERLAQKNPDVYTSDLAKMWHNLGSFYMDTGNSLKAEKAYTESLKKNMQVASWFSAAKAAVIISKIRNDRNILEKSRKLMELAILFSKEEKYKYAQKGVNEYLYWSLLEENMDIFGVLETLRDPELLSLPWDRILSQKELSKAQKDRRFQKTLTERILNQQVPCRVPPDFPEELLFTYIQKVTDYLLFVVVGGAGIKKFKCGNEFLSIGNALRYNFSLQHELVKNGHDLDDTIRKFEILSAQWQEKLPQEIKRLIQEKDYIVFSPDSTCSFFPLEALPIDGEPICIEKTVVRATSLHQFLSISKRNLCFDSSLIVGNPWPGCSKKELVYTLPRDSKQFRISFLQGARKEMKSLAEKLPNTVILLGQKATGERFLSEISKHSLIHFSGHGSLGRILFLSGPLKGFPPQFEPEEFSNLRIAERVDGKRVNMMEEWHPVTDLDLFDIKLTEGAVIFLNACETGQHKYAGGGYYQGLSAVFLKNRASSVISSLVPIFDEPSKEFALHFYDNLLRTQSVSQSLKKARTWTKNKYKAQIHWIPYIHYGSPL